LVLILKKLIDLTIIINLSILVFLINYKLSKNRANTKRNSILVNLIIINLKELEMDLHQKYTNILINN